MRKVYLSYRKSWVLDPSITIYITIYESLLACGHAWWKPEIWYEVGSQLWPQWHFGLDDSLWKRLPYTL